MQTRIWKTLRSLYSKDSFSSSVSSPVRSPAPDELGGDDLRPVVQPKRNETSAHPSADDHARIPLPVEPRVVLREKSLSGGEQSSRERNAELASVGVAGEDQIDAAADVKIEKFRPMGQKNGKDAAVPQVVRLYQETFPTGKAGIP